MPDSEIVGVCVKTDPHVRGDALGEDVFIRDRQLVQDLADLLIHVPVGRDDEVAELVQASA